MQKQRTLNEVSFKEVCNGGVACSLLKLGSLEKTVIASLFHSGLHSGTIFLWKKRCHICIFLGNDRICRFSTKKDWKILWCQIDFWSFATFYGPTILWSGAKPKWKNPGSRIFSEGFDIRHCGQQELFFSR